MYFKRRKGSFGEIMRDPKNYKCIDGLIPVCSEEYNNNDRIKNKR